MKTSCAIAAPSHDDTLGVIVESGKRSVKLRGSSGCRVIASDQPECQRGYSSCKTDEDECQRLVNAKRSGAGIADVKGQHEASRRTDQRVGTSALELQKAK